jgi:hypothetical protein
MLFFLQVEKLNGEYLSYAVAYLYLGKSQLHIRDVVTGV